jgi:hypothetical protein
MVDDQRANQTAKTLKEGTQNRKHYVKRKK